MTDKQADQMLDELQSIKQGVNALYQNERSLRTFPKPGERLSQYRLLDEGSTFASGAAKSYKIDPEFTKHMLYIASDQSGNGSKLCFRGLFNFQEVLSFKWGTAVGTNGWTLNAIVAATVIQNSSGLLASISNNLYGYLSVIPFRGIIDEFQARNYYTGPINFGFVLYSEKE